MKSDCYYNNCRICGLELSKAPWGKNEDTPSFDICPCCGVEFGYEDITLSTICNFREQWLIKGAQWFRPKMKPDCWNLKKQLRQISPKYR